MERHSVRGARSDQPTERCRPEARRSESAHFRTGCRGATHRCRPFTAKNPRAQLKTPMHCDASAGTPPAPRTPPTTRPNRARTLPHLRLRSLAARNGPFRPTRKTRGLFRESPPCFREKRGTFLKHTGTFSSISSLMHHLSSNKIDKTASSHLNITVGVLIRGGYKKLVSFLFGQQGRDAYFCGVLQQYYTETLHTMMI